MLKSNELCSAGAYMAIQAAKQLEEDNRDPTPAISKVPFQLTSHLTKQIHWLPQEMGPVCILLDVEVCYECKEGVGSCA